MASVKPILCAALLVAGCDAGTNNNNGSPDLSMTTMEMNDLSFIRPKRDLSDNPDLGEPGGCGMENSACGMMRKGLCKANSCSDCNDATDDANCAAAYGAGFACSSGHCQMGGCKSNMACMGKICDQTTGKCRSCVQDADCPMAKPSCDTTTGMCVATPPTCTAGTACGTAGTGFCCGGTPTCFDGGNCCQDSDCTGSGKGDKCNTTTHVCYTVSACPSPAPAAKFYVDPAAASPNSGVGSKQCPFSSLDTALSNVPSGLTSTFTICTKGTFDSTNNKKWPRHIPTNVELDGYYCDSTSTTRTTFTVPAGNSAVYFDNKGPGLIHGYDITLAGSDKTNSGIYVTNTGTTDPVTIRDVSVKSFERGIYVTKGSDDTRVGNATINGPTDVRNNQVGLRINSGATAKVNVTTNTDNQAQFESNDEEGIYVSNGTLTVKGALRTNASTDNDNPRTVSANSNGQFGIWIDDPAAVVDIDFMKMYANIYSGFKTVNNATVKATNSVFSTNGRNGIVVVQSGTATSVSGINLGKSGSPGLNVIKGNTRVGLCVNFPISDPLAAVGNLFSGVDCSASSPSGKVSITAVDCLTGPDGTAADLFGWQTDDSWGITFDNCYNVDNLCLFDVPPGTPGGCK